MAEQLVRYSSSGGIAVLEPHDPPANTYSLEMMKQLDQAILRARFDRDVHVLVLRGSGDKFFRAGADITMLRQADADFKDNFCLHAPPKRPSNAMGLIKRAVQSGGEVSFHQALALERELQQRLFESHDAAEGSAAYLEKRQSRFEGR